MIKFGIDPEDKTGINLHYSCPEESDKPACEAYGKLAEDVSRRGFNVYVPEYGFIKEMLKSSDQVEKKVEHKKNEKVKEDTEVKGE